LALEGGKIEALTTIAQWKAPLIHSDSTKSEAGWAPQPVWSLGRRDKSLAPAGD